MFLVAWLAVVTLVAAGCGGGDGRTSGTDGGDGALPAAQLSLVAYSTPQEAYKKIIAAFRASPEGRNITFTESYGASGEQSRAVEAGLPADVVEFSLEPDMSRLVKANIVPPDWNANPHKGMVSDSVVVLVVRKGNPENIKGWEDLTRPGLEVITPNPFTSGGARWNVMAAYGAASQGGKDEAKGVAYLNALFKNVKVQDESARKSLQTFTTGKGDVLLAYENEAIFAQKAGQAIDYVIPEATILIENPVAVTQTSKNKQQAQAFLDFLYGQQAQRLFADAGYRPVVQGVARPDEFPQPGSLFTIADLGGWTTVSTKFFHPAEGIMADVERGIGVSVEQR